MKRRDVLIYSAGAPLAGLLQGCGGGDGEPISLEQTSRSQPTIKTIQKSTSNSVTASFRYLGQSDFANSMSNLLYAGSPPSNAPSIDAFDPYWVDVALNQAATGVVTASGSNGYDDSNRLIAYKALKVGVPTVDLSAYTGLTSPNTSNFRACTAGVLRATGVQLDAAGRVGMFINGFDTPSDNMTGGGFKSYGPDIHISRTYLSPAIYLGPASTQCLHMACTLSLGETYFSPAAGTSAGVGGQIGWRASFVRSDGGPFFSNVTSIVLLVGLWDSRNVGNPGFDGDDSSPSTTQGENWISGTLVTGKTSKFLENYGTNMMTGPTGSRRAEFYWNISRTNMINILAAFGATATTPEMIRLSQTTFNCELYDNRSTPAKFKPGQFGFYFENQTVDIW